MKKIIYLVLVLAVISCKTEPKNYVTFSGEITNQNSDSVVIRSREYSKTIPVSQDGTFSDTLKVNTGIYNFYDGSESTSIFLKNGYDIRMTLDTKMFDETAKYSGTGSENSNFLAQNSLLQEKLLDKDFDGLGTKELNTTFEAIKRELTEFVNSNKNIDSIVVNNALNSIDPTISRVKNYYTNIAELYEILPKGSPSPTFENYVNYNGGTTSLSDLKGKYVYVDVWATWCGPCKREIPYLKEVEKKYHGKDIAFVSLSVDDDRRNGSWDKAKENWRNMIAEKELGGIQIFAPEAWKSKFVSDYKITGIPRFILIDPNGNVVSPNAPRPSSPKLIELFEKENI
ncbi:TlpA family protein disulfide reductase [Urechidicola croceus]|uniref:Thioredoxin n=1 Tax=Urechidicola croceus TaxID=1850246 RepID=A0A1D8P691_9FLAO|nr:TlpA disulfide reductase family protein [Urechidicola croceus]AOW20079.1 thioredoxin [Urechidicola croceus]